jgi:hypothetical protein
MLLLLCRGVQLLTREHQYGMMDKILIGGSRSPRAIRNSLTNDYGTIFNTRLIISKINITAYLKNNSTAYSGEQASRVSDVLGEVRAIRFSFVLKRLSSPLRSHS